MGEGNLTPPIFSAFRRPCSSGGSALGLALWNRNSFEFKFDDTRLSSHYRNEISPIICFCWVLTLQSLCPVDCLSLAEPPNRAQNLQSQDQTKKKLMGPILLLYYEESLVSSNLNSKLLWFHNVRPTLHIYQPEARCQYQWRADV